MRNVLGIANIVSDDTWNVMLYNTAIPSEMRRTGAQRLGAQNGLFLCSCSTGSLSYSPIPVSIRLCIYREMTILTYFKLSKGIFLNFNVGKASWCLLLWLNVVQLLTAAAVRKAKDDCISVSFCHILVAKLLQRWWQWTKQEWQKESKLWIFWIRRSGHLNCILFVVFYKWTSLWHDV